MRVRQIKIGVKSWEENKKELGEVFRRTTKGKSPPSEDTLYFQDVATFRRCLPPQRLELLWVTAEKHPKSVRELASLLRRKAKSVSHDLAYLASIGLIEFRARGACKSPKAPVVPYDRVDLSVELRSRAA